MNFCFPDKCDMHAFVRPGAKLFQLVVKVEESIKDLGHNDFAMIFAGTNDADSGCCNESFFKTLTELAEMTIKTNLIVIGIPYRLDKPCLNKFIADTNRNIIDILSRFNHTQFLSLSSLFKSNFYVNPGLHFNLNGKRQIANLIFAMTQSHYNDAQSVKPKQSSSIPVRVSYRNQPILNTKCSNSFSNMSLIHSTDRPTIHKKPSKSTFLGIARVRKVVT